MKGDRSHIPYWHRNQTLKKMERLFCSCGALMYEGSKPKFSAISCPACKKVTEIKRET